MSIGRIISVALIVVFALGLIPFASAQEGSTPDYWPTEDWLTSTPEDQGMDSEKLLTFLKRMELSRGFHSLLVIRHGYVVLDASIFPYTMDKPHYLASTTKVITSTLLGMAIDQGYVQSVDQSIWDFFAKDMTANMDERKAVITIQNLLTQTSGFDFGFAEDWLEFSVLTAEDQSWVQFLLDRQMATEPGTTFNYMDGNPLLVSAIIGQATGMPTDEFARQNLLDPLGMDEVLWLRDPQGVSQGGDRCFMSAYDMARLGYLYLRKGEWDGQQIVPAAWVEEATSNFIQPHYWEGYGYYWYSGPFGSGETAPHGFSALGGGGQEIWVIPELDLVIVITGDLFFNGLKNISEFGVPAVESNTPLPGNPEAYAALRAEIETLFNPTPVTVEPLPEIAQQISGTVYVLKENDLGWQTVSLEFREKEVILTLELADRTLELPIGLDGIERISSAGLPSEPIQRPVDNVPLASQGKWISNDTFFFTTRDMLGLVDAGIKITFGKTMYMNIIPDMGISNTVLWGEPQ